MQKYQELISDTKRPEIHVSKTMPTYIIVILGSVIVLLLTVLSGVYLTKLQNRKLAARNRRYIT